MKQIFALNSYPNSNPYPCRYEVLESIGSGAFGSVFLGKTSQLETLKNTTKELERRYDLHTA